MKSGEAATERLRPIFVWGQRMIVAVEIWFSARNCVSLLYEDRNRKRMDMKTTQEYDEQQECKQEVNEPIAGYGTIDALKVKLVKRIMGMEALEDVQSVLNFVERQKVSETFEQEWERGVTLEQFRDVCKGKLKEIYADM
jgi:hypothetical protein